MIDIRIDSGEVKNLDLFVRSLPGVLNRALAQAAGRVSSTAITRYMRDATSEPRRRRPDDFGPLRIVTGRLAGSLAGAQPDGANPESIYMLDALPDGGMKLTMGSRVPYARIHEYGGRAGRALASQIPGRPYLNPALQDEEPQIRGIIGAHVGELIEQVNRL